MKRLLPLLLPFLIIIPAKSEVDPKIHQLCLKASDYMGCINAQTGNLGSPKSVITNQGLSVTGGNKCPEGYASKGAGYCQEVVCKRCRSFGCLDGNNPDLAGKNWSCTRGMRVFLLRWGDNALRATYDPECPEGPIKVGYNSTCEQKELELLAEKAKEEKEKKKKNVGNINCNSPVWKNKPICN
tara:strand:+ start:111 stop:662 length:552 start_codon:yes stop_codon:yes gene_type:complete